MISHCIVNAPMVVYLCVCLLDRAEMCCRLADSVAQQQVRPNSSLRGVIYKLDSDGRRLATGAYLTDMELSFLIIYSSVRCVELHMTLVFV